MKDLERKPVNLTREPQKPYSKEDGDIFMPTEGSNNQEPPQRPISPEQKQKIDKAWQKHNVLRVSKGEKVGMDELRTQEMLKDRGFMPPLTQEAEDLLGKISDGGVPITVTNNFSRILKENGISDEDIANKKQEELIDMLKSNRFSEQKNEPQGKQASGASVPPGGGEPPRAHPVGDRPEEPDNGENGEDIGGPKPPSTENIDFESLPDGNPLKNLLETYSRQLSKGILDSNVSSINDYIKSVSEVMSDLSPQERQMATLFMSSLEDYIGEINQYEIDAKRLSEGERRIRALHEWSRREVGQGGVDLSRLLTDRAYRDEVFNRLFASVEATPHQQFREAFNPLTYGRYYEVFMDIMREASTDMRKIVEDYGDILDLRNTSEDSDLIKEAKRKIQQALSGGNEKISFEKELKDDFRRYQLERQARETLHDVNTLIYLPSIQMKGLAESAYMQQFSTQLADFAQKTPGVKEMMDIYEAQLRESMRQHDGFLPTEEVIGKVTRGAKGNPIDVGLSHIEVETKKIFKEKIRKRLVTIRILDGGVLKPESIGELPDWEIDRTFSVARGMMLVNLRLVSIAAESKLAGYGGRFASVFLQDVLQSYSPYRHLIAKYGVVESAIAALMHTPQGEKGNWFVDFFKSKHPEELKKVLEEFEGEDKTPEEKQKAFDNLLYAGDIMRYVMKQNPNRAGDLYTFFTWRGASDGTNSNPASITEEFVKEGSERMKRRLNLGEPLTGKDKEKVSEYKNWVGTALRLEMLRGGVESEINKVPGREKYSKYIEDLAKEEKLNKDLAGGKITEEEKKKLSKKIGIDNREKSWKIIEQMVRFQHHRLFEVSEDVRKRILGGLTQGLNDEQRKGMLSKIPNILGHISDVETAILRDREQILDDGKTFDGIDLSDAYFVERYINNQNLINSQDREDVISFIKIMTSDFKSNPESYWKEFISQREYTHGFVLWTGDCPVDEFNMQALGQTGAIARRARDNNQQAVAMNKEIELLKNLKNIRTPDEVIAALHEIYEPIQGYDAGKAKQAIAEKVEGIIKFYSGDWLSRLPIIGILRDQFGVSSLAQALHGKEAPVWKPNEIRYLLTQLKNKEMINKIQFSKLADKTLSTRKDVVIDTVTFAGTFLSIAMLWYMINKISKEEK